MPQGGDDKYLAKIATRQAACPAFGPPGENHVPADAFLIRHYAGEVVYSSRGLVEKNADRLSRNLYDLLAGATDVRMRTIFPVRDEKTAGRVSTVGEKFRGQLAKLMKSVSATQPFFIRCIKPNQKKAPSTLEMGMSIEQLTYAGVFEAVKIRKSGCK